jgi:putative tryptophan/tyrosine transport system substrate-binding protein
VIVILTFALLAAPLAVGGQTAGNVRRVGIIHYSGGMHAWVDGLRQGLRELGLEEGKNLVLDIRETDYDLRAVEAAASDLERAKMDLLYTVTTSVTAAAKRATVHVPIVFFAGTDPVAAGLVESLARPGGRLTGVHTQTMDLTAKRLEILKEMIPRLRRVVTFYNPDMAISRESARVTRKAAQQLGVQLVERHVRSIEALRRGLQALKPREVDGYFETTDPMVNNQAQLIIDAARANKLPTMFYEHSPVINGGLAGYGENFPEILRLSAKYVQRILAGTLPKDLPVENYDRIEFALNLRTAQEIGLAIPPVVRFRADTVIE